jgi:NADH-quinone oxidoreductase subunit C
VLDRLRYCVMGVCLMTKVLDPTDVASRIREAFPRAVEDVDDNEIFIQAGAIAEVCRSLRDDEELNFEMLRGLDVVDHIDRFELRYGLLSIARNHETVLKVRLWEREEPSVPSVVGVWEGANLQEREIYDLMGVTFEGHPNMKRVLLWEGFPGHPLRKDFP